MACVKLKVAPLDTNGLALSYLDSGAVVGSDDYTTVFVFHVSDQYSQQLDAS